LSLAGVDRVLQGQVGGCARSLFERRAREGLEGGAVLLVDDDAPPRISGQPVRGQDAARRARLSLPLACRSDRLCRELRRAAALTRPRGHVALASPFMGARRRAAFCPPYEALFLTSCSRA